MIQGTLDAVKRRFHGLRFAYHQVFDTRSPHTVRVLQDLARFCRAHESTFHPDPRVHAALEGRREVWLKIQQNLQLDMEEIYQLHKIKEIKQGE